MKEITKEIKDYLLSVGYPDKEKIYYLEVWLWLWREKKISLELFLFAERNVWYVLYDGCREMPRKDDPEEAIEKAIEHLVENDLIK